MIKKPEYILPIESTPIPGGETVVIESSRSQVSFKPRRFAIPNEVASAFDIEAIKIKGVEQFRTGGPIPASVFSFSGGLQGFFTEESGFKPFDLTAMEIGDSVSIRLKNRTPQQRNFCGVFTGETINDTEESSIQFDSRDSTMAMGFPEREPSAHMLLAQAARRAMANNVEIYRLTAMALGQGSLDGNGKKLRMIGFDTTAIPASTSANICKRSQVMCKPKYLFIPEHVAQHIAVVDFRVGKNSQTLACGEIPGLAFSERGLFRLDADVCQVGMDMVVFVRNKSDKVVDFECVVFAEILKG